MLAFFLQPDKRTLVIPDWSGFDAQAEREVGASIKLSSQLLQSARDGQWQLSVAAVKASAPNLKKEDLVVSEPASVPVVTDGKMLLDKLQELEKTGDAICQEVVLPDEKIAFMPPPPPPPPPPKATPVAPRPKSNSSSTALRSGQPRSSSNRKGVTQLQRPTSDEDIDFAPQRVGSNQVIQGQKMPGQRIPGQRMH
jgi:hypothetical protein